MSDSLYSLRMRASSDGQHLSGAERIVEGSAIAGVTAELMARASGCSDPGADEIHCSMERLDPETVRREILPVISTFRVSDWPTGRQLARHLLVRAGVHDGVAEHAVSLLAEGAGPDGSVMRGAVIMDAQSGARLDDDRARGVRVSRMDLAPESREEINSHLQAHGLTHDRVREALVLAGKVSCAPGVVAELCWSDAPDYTTGYVSSPRYGYQRITRLKPEGCRIGGRVFFVDAARCNGASLVSFLERQPVLFHAVGRINDPLDWTENNG